MKWTLLACVLAIGCGSAESVESVEYDAGPEVEIVEADADVKDAADDVPVASNQKDGG
jgi:hypothetical protein